MPTRIPATVAVALAASLAPALPIVAQDVHGPFRITAPGVADTTVANVAGDLVWAEVRIADWLGPFPDTVSVGVFGGREAFSAALREAWGIPETACWMVGAADDHSLYLLAPDVWGRDACEHDPSDVEQRRLLVAHEAVHVYHGQVNPTPDIGLLEDVGWFVEGLATFVSGQLDGPHAGRAAEAIRAGEAPERLHDAWSGPYRYGVSGSLVAYIDARWGRDTLRVALELTSWAAFAELLQVTEADFLSGWRAWVQEEGAAAASSPTL